MSAALALLAPKPRSVNRLSKQLFLGLASGLCLQGGRHALQRRLLQWPGALSRALSRRPIRSTCTLCSVLLHLRLVGAPCARVSSLNSCSPTVAASRSSASSARSLAVCQAISWRHVARTPTDCQAQSQCRVRPKCPALASPCPWSSRLMAPYRAHVHPCLSPKAPTPRVSWSRLPQPR
jgi:hypothetical protein